MTFLSAFPARALVLVTICLLCGSTAFSQVQFVRGDCNVDGEIDISDPIRLLLYNFGGAAAPSCLDACDANDDGNVAGSTTDAIYLLQFLFQNGPEFLAPYPFCGVDRTQDSVDCGQYGLCPELAPLTIVRTSPTDGETGVAVTRETIIEFSNALNEESVTSEAISARFGGEDLVARLHQSADGSTVTLFYESFLPASARVRVEVDGDQLEDLVGRPIDADGDGEPGGVAVIDFDTLSLTSVPGTHVCGRVFASELVPAPEGAQSVNEPLEGVTITVDGLEDTIFAVTDVFGDFRLENAPAGEFFVHIDGGTATNGVPPGAYYPFVGKAWTSTIGAETSVGEIYLPLVAPETLQAVSDTEETTISFPESTLDDFPELAGVTITVPAGSLFADDGTPGGLVGIAPVDPDRLPGTLPPGLNFPLVITVQTDGATNFDRPVPVCFPNLPDPETGEVLPPGAKSALWSFNHDTGRFEVVGPMTVSADGQLVCTDPGVGIRAPGWHGVAPGSSGSEPCFAGPNQPCPVEPEGEAPCNECGCRNPPGQPIAQPPDLALNDDGNGLTDPVYLHSGELYLEAVDLRIRGRGFDFIWARKYRSRLRLDSDGNPTSTAQGVGWDFSYNISIQTEGRLLRVGDGNSRSDIYYPRPDGSHGKLGFFREVRNSTLTFADNGRWECDGPGGKISASVDRNGNRMTFHYDGQDRLDRITDTLDRDIEIAYNPQGFIESVTDFAGRTVSYEYYDGVELGGGLGDLKSVTTPTVVGTPNGNDFPQGKTTTYTYTSGFEDERLNHNLLAVTDGRRNDPSDPSVNAGPYVVNLYGQTTDPTDPVFDRAVRQVWGGDIVDIVYVPQQASTTSNLVNMKTIVNDRQGNVKEFFYSVGGRLAERRDYTGRADPRSPTTETGNRPQGKLRVDDPELFVTRTVFDQDFLLTNAAFPNGNLTSIEYESTVDPGTSSRRRGNIRSIHRLPGTHMPVGDQASIDETFEYDADFGGCCGFNFVTRHVDGRGNETLHEYDPRGNRVRTTHREASIVEDFEYNDFGQMTARVWPDSGSGHRRRDEYRYYEAGTQTGYLREVSLDSENIAITYAFEYDLVGNIVSVVDPRGDETQFFVNQLDQVVRVVSPEVELGSGILYELDLSYDANNNLIRLDRVNIDEEGTLQTNSHLSTTLEYEILNEPVRMTEEIDATRNVVTEYEYDNNRNLALVRFGEATRGTQFGNTIKIDWDERDLLFREVRAPGAPEQSTTQVDYDRNGNTTRQSQGLEGEPRITTNLHDAYDRLVESVDPMGNVTTLSYDANSNPTHVLHEGESTDLEGSSGNLRLFEDEIKYDLVDRPVERLRAFFETETQNPISGGVSVTEIEHSDSSQLVRIVNDNGHETLFAYDTALRLATVTDALGNTTDYAYDSDSNVTSITEREKSDLGATDQVFQTIFEYDRLDRLALARDNIGNTTRYGYDSRDNLTLTTDPLGNITRRAFDGLDRLVSTSRVLTGDGTGAGAVIGDIVTLQAWDDSSRLIGRTDDNGNTCVYTYDPLDRATAVSYADGTEHTYDYDVHDNVVANTDANGSVVTSEFDLLDRTVRHDILPGPGVSLQTTFERFEYDGLSRLTRAEDDDSLVMRRYDSLSSLLAETVGGATTTMINDGVGNRLSCVYPGGRTVTCTYDALERKKTIRDATGDIASYFYVGPERVERCELGNGTRTDLRYDGITGMPNPVGDFGVRELIETTHTRLSDGAVIDARRYLWDSLGNKVERDDARAGGSGRIETFEYDSVYRLVTSIVAENGGPAIALDYALDGVGNRVDVTGGNDPGPYVMDATLPEPGDRACNQYTETPFDGRLYDPNGNLLTAVQGAFTYDYANRLVGYTEGAGVEAAYAYDAFGRRIERVVDDGGSSTTRYVYVDWQVVEEQDAAGATEASYVYGRDIDEVITMRRSEGDAFYHRDDIDNVVALTDAAGAVSERYAYEDFGAPAILDAAGTPRTASVVGNPYLFNSRRFDPETQWHYYRTRYLDSRAGRFATRDTIGVWGDPGNLGNAFAYIGNNPWSQVDPMGLNGKKKKRQTADDQHRAKVKRGIGGTADPGGAPYNPNVPRLEAPAPPPASARPSFKDLHPSLHSQAGNPARQTGVGRLQRLEAPPPPPACPDKPGTGSGGGSRSGGGKVSGVLGFLNWVTVPLDIYNLIKYGLGPTVQERGFFMLPGDTGGELEYFLAPPFKVKPIYRPFYIEPSKDA